MRGPNPRAQYQGSPISGRYAQSINGWRRPPCWTTMEQRCISSQSHGATDSPATPIGSQTEGRPFKGSRGASNPCPEESVLTSERIGRTSNELGVPSSRGVHDRGLLGTTMIGRVLSVSKSRRVVAIDRRACGAQIREPNIRAAQYQGDTHKQSTDGGDRHVGQQWSSGASQARDMGRPIPRLHRSGLRPRGAHSKGQGERATLALSRAF